MAGSERSLNARVRPRRLPRAEVRRHLPFLAFLAAFSGYAVVLQFWFADALSQLFLVRIFFQVAIAALAVAVLRNVVGVRTFGMFAPVVIALAFLATGLALGLALMALILGIVVLTRGALVRERILAPHRVAILVTVVAITISSVALVGLGLQHHELFFAVLFPVLISAWIGERYVEQVTRVGWEGPSKTLGWTIAAIALSFVVITQDPLVDFVMLNPLTWLLLLVLNWYLGTQVRFRLSERFRFGGVSSHVLVDRPLEGDFRESVLTIPIRNREFVAKYNPPNLMGRLAKDEVKALLVPRGVPMAQTYMVLKSREDLVRFRAWLPQAVTFAMKPASGYGGEGIVLVQGAKDGRFRTNFGVMDAAALEAHALAIVEGEFHDGQRDVVLVEELLVQHEGLRDLVPQGLADIRIISFLGFPVMAMMRIPTRASRGKANLHAGALAAGVRISTGTIVHAIWRGRPQPRQPDTGAALLGRTLPQWVEILEVAAEAQRLSGLGFAGVDIALDARQGPIVMEVNRRPGLEIQVANAAGLLRRLRAVESLPARERPVEERVEAARRVDADNWGIRPPAREPPGAPRFPREEAELSVRASP